VESERLSRSARGCFGSNVAAASRFSPTAQARRWLVSSVDDGQKEVASRQDLCLLFLGSAAAAAASSRTAAREDEGRGGKTPAASRPGLRAALEGEKRVGPEAGAAALGRRSKPAELVRSGGAGSSICAAAATRVGVVGRGALGLGSRCAFGAPGEGAAAPPRALGGRDPPAGSRGEEGRELPVTARTKSAMAFSSRGVEVEGGGRALAGRALLATRIPFTLPLA
jgi:hypothetical protein